MTNAINTIITLLLILLSILFGMTVHEMGHFIFAKIFKVNVKEFSIGIGPKLLQWKAKNGMRISLRLFPLMAYVMIDSRKIIGLYNEILEEHIKEKEKLDQNISKAKLSQNKFKIWWYGLREKSYFKQLSHYEYYSSFEEGNILIEDISLWKKILILFGGVFVNFLFFLLFWLIQYFGFNIIESPFKQIGESFKAIWENMTFQGAGTGSIIGGTIEGNIPNSNAKEIFTIIFNYLTIFNLMLFIYNLLPIPPLDGYKIIIECVETATKKKIPRSIEVTLTIIGYLILLYVFITSIIPDFK